MIDLQDLDIGESSDDRCIICTTYVIYTLRYRYYVGTYVHIKLGTVYIGKLTDISLTVLVGLKKRLAKEGFFNN